MVDGKPGFYIYLCTNTKGNKIGSNLELKLSLIILDDNNNVLLEKKVYTGLSGGSSINNCTKPGV